MTLPLYPAIDLLGGRCVRLFQGDYGRATDYGDDPVAMAEAFADDGAAWLHVVDLDAARTGEPTNRAAIAAITEAVAVPVQTGGGVRSIAAAEALFDAGVTRVVIGTAALENPGLVRELAASRPVAVGLDARGGQLASHGWEQATGRTVTDVATEFADAGVAALVATEIGRDGTLAGPDIDGLGRLLADTELDVIASGGVGSYDDLAALAVVEVDGKRLAGAIVGRALYEGAIELRRALAVTGGGD